MLGNYLCYCGKEFNTYEEWFWHDEEFGCTDTWMVADIKIHNNEPLTEGEKKVIASVPAIKLNRAWQAEKAGGMDKLLLQEKTISDKLTKEILKAFRYYERTHPKKKKTKNDIETVL